MLHVPRHDVLEPPLVAGVGVPQVDQDRRHREVPGHVHLQPLGVVRRGVEGAEALVLVKVPGAQLNSA